MDKDLHMDAKDKVHKGAQINSLSTEQILVQAPVEFVQFKFGLVTRQGMPVAD